MNLETILVTFGAIVALALVALAVVLLRGNYTMRARLVATFLALTLVPALFTMALLWRELRPEAWTSATRSVGFAMESSLILARNVVTDRLDDARLAAELAIQRLQHRGLATAEDLAALLDQPYTAFFCAGPAGEEHIVAAHSDWDPAAAQAFVRDLLPSRRHGVEHTQLVLAPDSTRVVVSVAQHPSPQTPQSNVSAISALIALPLAAEDAAAIEAVVESYQRQQQLGLLEVLHLRHTGFFLAILAAFFVVAATLLGVILARTLTHPINRLMAAFASVAGGALGVQVQPRSPGELGRLTESFNRMSLDLQRSQLQLVQATRLAAWQGVARRLAHEIKNPLTPITLSIHRLRKRTAPQDPVVDECLDAILEETSHLERLANEFSAFARSPKPQLAAVDTSEVLQQVLDLYAATPNVRWRAQLRDLPQVWADRDQIRQVFTNLIKNAIEAMPDGGEVDVAWTRQGEMVALVFSDEGIGLPSNGNVFEPTFTTKASGSGLGLAIVRRIVEDHGGDIEVGNREGRGAWVRVRLRQAHPNLPPEAETRPEKGAEIA